MYYRRYNGNGQSTLTLNCPFSPVAVFIKQTDSAQNSFHPCALYPSTSAYGYNGTRYTGINIEWGNKQIIISNDRYSFGLNESSTAYVLIVVGVDVVLPFTRTFTESTTYTIPVTGKYNLELYGGGGGVYASDFTSSTSGSKCYGWGGSSC